MVTWLGRFGGSIPPRYLLTPVTSAVTTSAGCRVTWENLGRLTCYVGAPQRVAVPDPGEIGGVPRQADVLETGDIGGDKLSGNSQAFRGRKRISEHGKHLEPVFCGKLANLEAQAAHLTQDTKNALFGVRRFQRFLLQKRSGDEAVWQSPHSACRV